MMTRLTILILISGLVLAACSENSHTNNEPGSKKTSGDHIWKTQTDALEKAQNVESTLQNQAQKLDQRIPQ